MTPLTQETLEALLKNRVVNQAPCNVIYFTASWCGPCNALPLDKIVNIDKNINWYLCDVDDNQYSPGYCGVKSVPSFLGIVHGKPTALLQTSAPNDIYKWLYALTSLPKH
jgi:thioredoxin-like negative regulator of GroEL